eukprot:361568-Chlamydomonas_euryale.AAC.4
MSEAEVRERFAALNGVLIPGGGASLSPGHMFYDTAALLYELAVEANDNGDYFPVWARAVCVWPGGGKGVGKAALSHPPTYTGTPTHASIDLHCLAWMKQPFFHNGS